MDADQQWIWRRVALATAASVVASVLITLSIYLLATGSLAGSALGLTIAVIAPALIAPVGSYQYISLSYRLRRANERLRILSEMDSLTSTLNRRKFMEVAGKHLSLARRHGHPVSVLLIDFDHFKQVNDKHGHAVGDQVLVRTVGNIRETIRDTDALARIGGEEFILLLPHTAREGAEELAGRVLETVRKTRISAAGQHIQVTVSLGGSTCEQGTTNLDELMSAADKLLYEAKQAGRDRALVSTVTPIQLAAEPLSQAS